MAVISPELRLVPETLGSQGGSERAPRTPRPPLFLPLRCPYFIPLLSHVLARAVRRLLELVRHHNHAYRGPSHVFVYPLLHRVSARLVHSIRYLLLFYSNNLGYLVILGLFFIYRDILDQLVNVLIQISRQNYFA